MELYDKGNDDMGDMMGEIAVAEERYKKFENYLHAMVNYLTDSGEDNFELVVKAVKHCDKRLLRGYWEDRFNISIEENIRQRFGKILKGLVEKDKGQWAKFLTQAMAIKGEIFHKIKSISPFADMILVPIFYGYGFAKITSDDLEQFLTKLVGKKRREIHGSGSTYFIGIPKSVDGPEVFFIDSI